jgi:hypothetical protein
VGKVEEACGGGGRRGGMEGGHFETKMDFWMRSEIRVFSEFVAAVWVVW